MREDVHELARLNEAINLEEVPYEEILNLYRNFIFDILKENKNKINSNFYEHSLKLLNLSADFFLKHIDSKEMANGRVEAWKLHDKTEDRLQKSIVRAIVCCLYEEDTNSEEFDNYSLFELFFSILLDIGAGYCAGFRKLCQQRLSG